MQSFLNFDKMITPAIIKVIFYVFSILSILAGLITMVNGANSFGGGVEVLLGLVIMLMGPFLTRIYCELLIVLFKMHENLHLIASQKNEYNNQNNIAN